MSRPSAQSDEDGTVIASVLALPGCHTADNTEREALHLILILSHMSLREM